MSEVQQSVVGQTKGRKTKNRTRPEVAEYVRNLRQATVCERCGGQPIEWHNETHPKRRSWRITTMVQCGYKLPAVLKEISTCQALCRYCHMTIDGRMEALRKRKKDHPFFTAEDAKRGEAHPNAILT